MQSCFRKYPEIYGAELQDDEEEEGATPAPEDVAANGSETIVAEPKSGAALTEATASAPGASNPAAAASMAPATTNDMSQRLRNGPESVSAELPQQVDDATAANSAKKA